MEATYIKGFNHGYLLTRYEPVLAQKLTQTIGPTNEYLSGFFSGKREWELEHGREKLNQLQNMRQRGLDRERGIDDR